MNKLKGNIKNLQAFVYAFSIMLMLCFFVISLFTGDIVTIILCLCGFCIIFSVLAILFDKSKDKEVKLEKEKFEELQEMMEDREPDNKIDSHEEVMNEILGSKKKEFSYDEYRGPLDPTVMSDSYNRAELNEQGKIVRYKDGNGVEGIIEGREYHQVDKDKDGRILVSEYYPLTEAEVLEKILAVDASFSKMQFKTFVRGIFMLIQKAWSNNDYHTLRAFEADSLYFEHKIKIEELIRDNIYDKRENIGIKGVLLKDFKVEGDKEILTVALTARMDRDFSGDVFKSRDSSYYLSKSALSKRGGNVPYIMTFVRNKGVKSKTGVALATTNCCNCGAPITVDDKGVCTYCKTSLVSGEVDWVLVDIKNIELVEF